MAKALLIEQSGAILQLSLPLARKLIKAELVRPASEEARGELRRRLKLRKLPGFTVLEAGSIRQIFSTRYLEDRLSQALLAYKDELIKLHITQRTGKPAAEQEVIPSDEDGYVPVSRKGWKS